MEFDFAEVLLQVMERNASDLHLTAGSPPMIRHHGRLHALDYPHLTPQLTREVIYSILTNDQRQRLETDWQIDFAYSIPGKARFRVNAYMQRAALSAAFRLIPHDMPKLSSLGLPPQLEDFTKKPRGFVLVTGPTGSGKSTTLAAMLDLINDTRHEHILTIERSSSEEIRKVAVAQGMRPLRADGFEKVKNGVTSIAEVARVT